MITSCSTVLNSSSQLSKVSRSNMSERRVIGVPEEHKAFLAAWDIFQLRFNCSLNNPTHLNCKLCDKFPAGGNIWLLRRSRQQHICEEFPKNLRAYKIENMVKISKMFVMQVHLIQNEFLVFWVPCDKTLISLLKALKTSRWEALPEDSTIIMTAHANHQWILPDSCQQLLLCFRKLHDFLFSHFQLRGSQSVSLWASGALPPQLISALFCKCFLVQPNTRPNLVQSRCCLRLPLWNMFQSHTTSVRWATVLNYYDAAHM